MGFTPISIKREIRKYLITLPRDKTFNTQHVIDTLSAREDLKEYLVKKPLNAHSISHLIKKRNSDICRRATQDEQRRGGWPSYTSYTVWIII